MALYILLAAAIALAALVWWRPYLPARCLLWLFVRLFYRMRVYGAQNIPQRGPALLVCNHVSYIDFVLLLVAQHRFIRFVMFAGWTKVPFLRNLLTWSRVIPIDASSGPKAIIKSLRTAGEALAKGDLVCIFAEGRFTRTGFLLPFHRGFEQIVKHSEAPIIPVCLDELWGSIFSFYGDRTLWKWPRMLPYPVTVAFGKPMPATSTAAEVRQAVQELSADCAIARTNEARAVHREFVRTAARRPFRTCVIDATAVAADTAGVYRYATVLACAICLTRQLRRRLVNRSLVGIYLPPGIRAVTAHLAAAFCGQAVVHLDESLSADAIQSRVRQCNLRHVLTAGSFLKDRPPVKIDAVEWIDIDSLEQSTSGIRRLWTQCCAVVLPGWMLDRWVLRLGRHQLDDLAAVVFTRGTTGEPKGVKLTHRNLVAAITSLVKVVDPLPRDRLLAPLPLSHCTGYVCTLWAPLTVGASVVFAATSIKPPMSSADAATLGQLCRTHHCTIFPAAPELLQRCLAHCLPDDFRSLHTLVCSGAKLPSDTAAQFTERFGIKPLEAYDCTELSSIAITNVRDKTLENFTQIGHNPGTVGQPLPTLACRIADPATLEPLPAGQAGLLIIRGANVMQGYLNRDDLTQSALHHGWFNTGDRATMDEEGFVTIAPSTHIEDKSDDRSIGDH